MYYTWTTIIKWSLLPSEKTKKASLDHSSLLLSERKPSKWIIRPMLQNFCATSFSVAACTVFATPAVLAQAETPLENHANYASHWLYIQTYTTAPSYTLEPTVGNPEGAADLAHQQKVLDTYGLTRATMDQAPLDIKIKLIKGNNYSFVESEATGSQVIPMPTLEACRTAGSIAVDRLTMPSTMTMARFSCLPGR